MERLKQKSSNNSNRRVQPQIAKPIRPGQHLAVIRPNSSTIATHGSEVTDPSRQQQGNISFFIFIFFYNFKSALVTALMITIFVLSEYRLLVNFINKIFYI